MSKKNNKKNTKKKKTEKYKKVKLIQKKPTIAEKLDLKEKTIKIATSIIFIFFSIFLFSAAFSYAGPVGDFFFEKLTILLGVGYFIVPVLFLALAFVFLKNINSRFSKIKIFGSLLFLISALGFIDLIFQKGGFLGGLFHTGTAEVKHTGGTIGLPSFHSGMRSDERLAKLQVGEAVINRGGAAKNRSSIEAMNKGYAVGGGGGNVTTAEINFTVQAIDAASFNSYLVNNKGTIEAIINQSLASNGTVRRTIRQVI